MGKREASRAPIPSSPQPLKRSRTRRAGSRSQRSSSSPRLKRPRTLSLDDAPPGLGACSSDAAEIRSSQSQPLKRKTLRGPCSNFPSWGPKRARTAYSYSRERSRDWANLGDGPAGLIAELVLAKNLADYIRFRAVCGPWRRCSAHPRACGVLDRRFHPRGWILLREKQQRANNPQTRLHRFLNVGTGQCIQVVLPELVDHHRLLIQSTTEGLLVLLCRATNAIRLLNPLTRQVAELPQITTRLASEFRGDAPDNAGLADDHTVVLYFCRMETLAFAKPGDEHWVLIKFKKPLMPTMSFQGRFYGVTTNSVMVVDTSREETPRLVVAAKLAKPFGRMVDTVHLVELGGELMLVHRKIRKIRDEDDAEEERFKRKYKVYRVDLDAGKTTPVHGGLLSGHAVFIGHYRTLCVSPQVFPNVAANTVYPGFDLGERTGDEQIGVYHLRDGSIEPSNYDRLSGLTHPLNAAEFLADCVRLV